MPGRARGHHGRLHHWRVKVHAAFQTTMQSHIALLASAGIGAGLHWLAQWLAHRCRHAAQSGCTPEPLEAPLHPTCGAQQGPSQHADGTTMGGEVLPFSDYAACRLLGLQPDSKVMVGSIYSALKSLAMNFLKADVKALEDSVAGCGILAALLSCAHHGITRPGVSSLLDMERCHCHFCQTHEWVDAALNILMRQLEVLLFKYLCYNWHREEDVVRVNEQELSRSQHAASIPSSLDSVVSFSRLDDTEGLTARGRAQHNWLKAKRAVIKYITVRRLQVRRRFETTIAIFKLLKEEGKEQRESQTLQLEVQQSLSAAGSTSIAAALGSEVEQQAQQQQQQVQQQQQQSTIAADGGSDGPTHQPVVLLLGGGMAAGKSTVRTLLDQSSFWSMIQANAVTVEADAIKRADVVYRSLHERVEFEHDLSLDVLVHDFATQAAEAALVAAINHEKDVVFDGTQAWAPFVTQTIAMVRNHKQHNFVVGPGYHKDKDTGDVHEQYYVVDDRGLGSSQEAVAAARRRRSDYRIELVGVCCHPALAVARGIWRRIRTGRSVPVKAQLRSHRLFATNFEHIAQQVDSATLYFSGANLTMFNKHERSAEVSPRVIAHSSESTGHAMITNQQMYAIFQHLKAVNDEASSIHDLFTEPMDTAAAPFPLVPAPAGSCLQEVQSSFRDAHVQELKRIDRSSPGGSA